MNFLVVSWTRTARRRRRRPRKIFLGLQVQCTQCHNHPFNDWKQNQFWEFNAFFRQTRALRRKARAGEMPAQLVNEDFAGERTTMPEEAIMFYELRNGLLSRPFRCSWMGRRSARAACSAKVEPPDGAGQADRRTREYMDKTIVNRMWGHFLGYGFTKPVDDLGPHNARRIQSCSITWARSSASTASTSRS